jgi:signal peptidase I
MRDLQSAPLASRGEVRATRLAVAVAGTLVALLLLGALLLVLGARTIGWSPGARTVHVVGSAMAPTVDNGDYLLVQPYSASTPRQGDIVLFHDPYTPSHELIKRVVAGPGQTVLIRHAQVIVDGKPVAELYIAEERWTALTEWPASGSAVRLGSDRYFVLGDNRNHSADSRTFGPIRGQDIWGRAVRILLPTQRSRAL